MLGAGFIGIEAAEALNRQGLDTTVIELDPHVVPALNDGTAWAVTQELRRLGITLHAGVAVFEQAGVATERGAILVDDHGRTNLPGVWAVGDATASIDPVTGARRPVALAVPAKRVGRLIADPILRPDTARPVPQPLGTAIGRVGDVTAAMTSANRATLDTAGVAYTTLHLHPNQHAGYFPGASQIHLSLHIRRVDGLIGLDLSYSPPYGQAKDAVNLVGMVAANVLDGTLTLWDACTLDQTMQDALVLDVRSAEEVAMGALQIPHTELRGRLDEVKAATGGRAVRVMCASGVRSAIAHRVLTLRAVLATAQHTSSPSLPREQRLVSEVKARAGCRRARPLAGSVCYGGSSR